MDMVQLELACGNASLGAGVYCNHSDRIQAEQDQGERSVCVGQHGFEVDESRDDYY
jgi:hypothetical protein